MFYAGIDWADDHHDVVVIDEAGKTKSSLRVAHTVKGLNELDTFLKSFTTTPQQMACIIETNQGLLISFLLEAGWTVYPVNPKTVDRKRSAAGAKTDKIDADLLAKTGRFDLPDLRQLKPDSPLVQELKELSRDQDKLIVMQTRLINQITACLKAYYPGALDLFSKVQQHSTLLFLQAYPTPAQAAAASLEEISEVLKKGGYTRVEEFAPKIYEKLHQAHLQANEITTRTKTRLLLALVSQLLPLLEQIAAYDKEIKQLFLNHPDNKLFNSLPGAAKRLAPRLLSEIGDDRERYPQATNLQAVAGSSPVPFESGNYSKMHRRVACIKPLRNALYQFAWLSTQQEEWAEEYYNRKRKEGKSHSVAVRSLANNWLRIIHAMWRNKTPYVSTTFHQAQQDHARKVA
jgi:transposase